MTLPLFAVFPPASLRVSLGPSQWESALDVWISIADIWLNAPARAFLANERDHRGLSKFLTSYYEEIHKSSRTDSTLGSEKSLSLRRRTFFLTHRLLARGSAASSSEHSLLHVDFLGAFCSAHLKSQALADLLEHVWQQYQPVLSTSLKSTRASLTTTLESSNPNVAETVLRRLSPLLHSLPQAGVLMTEGTEFIDAMFSAYNNGPSSLRTALVPVAYLSLISLAKGKTANRSALLDHLYSLKSQADVNKQTPNLLTDLVTNTPLLAKLPGQPGEKGAERARTLTAALGTFRVATATRPRRRRQPTSTGKGKGIATSDAPNDNEVQLMSRITQIQDLFPDLGAGFVSRLLSFYEQDVELATSQLLEDSLPPSLAGLDRTLQLPSPTPDPTTGDPPPQASLPIRRNVFDNDALDRLAVPASALHKGRSTTSRTADDELADRARAPAKSSILAALAAFDSDDDERDDTYDAADVGGTVDRADGDEAVASGDGGSDTQHQQALWQAWSADRAVFGREARRGKAREQLRTLTGWSDEMLEGWGTMLARDPARQRRLEARFAFAGAQREVGRTAYREGDDDEDDESEAGQQQQQQRGGYRGPRGGRGRGRGGRGGGGNVAGEPSDAQTQTARHRKEASKGSRANHNRRDQRARKMARGGFPG